MPAAHTILAGGFARPDSQSSLGDQFAFVRYSNSGFPDTLFNRTAACLQNLTPQAAPRPHAFNDLERCLS